MNIRCKFVCSRVEKCLNHFQGGATEEKYLFNAVFQAVTGKSGENEQFWKWTPSGKLEVTSIKCDAFEPGKEYYLDITEAPAEVKG